MWKNLNDEWYPVKQSQNVEPLQIESKHKYVKYQCEKQVSDKMQNMNSSSMYKRR